MKRELIMLIMLFGNIINLQSQTTHKAYDLAMKIKHKKGEVIVKFKDETNISLLKSAGVMKTGNSAIDAIARKWGVKDMGKVFQNVPRLKSAQFITLPDGSRKQLSQLYNIYKLNFPEEQDATQVVADFKALPDVEYAELNGVAYIHDLIPSSPILTEKKLSHKGAQISGSVVPNDPLYSSQWYLPAVKADSLWSYTTGDTTQVIGILDTGVDWLHPDLATKIWNNRDEIPDNGIDDDNNGFIDDIRGWDFVNQDNNPKDDNSHGTHCAGIAGAESNNGIGISGVSWGAKIMPIKVFQSNGIGYFSHIAEGFWYAAKNGCTVFSNSWSSSGESITIRLAMEYAYSKGLIVAAAGNMNTKTDLPCPPWPLYEPNFPACYNWVLGVEATDQSENNTGFSNFDPTGPVISDGRPYGSIYFNEHDYNYEMRAPGVSVMSTVPNGQYRAYSGTSMACPLVAGSIALMKSYDPKLSNEQVFAKLIQTIKLNKMQAGVLNILKCTTTNPPPELYYVKNEISDTQPGDDNDGRPDAGETINMHVTVKNAGGFGDSIYAMLRFAEFEDKTVAKILDNNCYLGRISTYGTQTSLDAIKIKIDSNLVDARMISFQILIYQQGKRDTIYNKISIKVEHGIEIHGTYAGLLHLKGNAYYLVTEPSIIDSLIIDPGVILRFKNNAFLMIMKHLYAVGTPDDRITFKGADDSFVHSITMANNAYSNFSYCIFQDGAPLWNTYLVNPTKIHHSLFRNNFSKNLFSFKNEGNYQYNVFTENNFSWPNAENAMIKAWEIATFKNNILADNQDLNKTAALMIYGHHLPYPQGLDSIINNTFINNNKYSVSTSDWNGWPMGIYKLNQNYWGTSDIATINLQILDFYENSSVSVLEPKTILQTPPESCHGVTWKVEINEKNPQDTSLIIGNGPTKFSVYFNRPMDPAFTPFLTFGVRFPYTQNVALDSARWSSDHKTWTAYKTIDVSTGDGENMIRVAYAKDLEHFEIPIERSRFKFVVQAASSQSLEFIATPGIGKVKLEWPLSDKTNVVGYNMYRFTIPTSSTFSDTVLINNTLITDSLYTDFSVNPGTKYYYIFKPVRTDLSSGDFSKVVQATPFDAPNGDANGDLAINVLDITSIVAYLLNNNPQPFIFEAADYNGDGKINVLDIVAVVNVILGKKSAMVASNQQIHLYVKNDTLFADTPVEIGGIQFEINGATAVEDIQKLKALEGFESGYSQQENGLQLLYYSMSGKSIPAGNGIPLLKLKNGSGITEAIFADKTGTSIAVDFLVPEIGRILDNPKKLVAELGQNFPNPFSNLTTIPYLIFEPVDEAVIRIFNIAGQEVKIIRLPNPIIGEHLLQWDSDFHKGLLVCVLEVRQGKKQFVCPARKMIVN